MKRSALNVLMAGGFLTMAALSNYYIYSQVVGSDDYADLTGDKNIAKFELTKIKAPDAVEMREFVSRPLFLPSRRPQPKPALAPQSVAAELQKIAAPPVPEPVLTLIGVIITPTGREAIVRNESGVTSALEEGSVVGSWSLRRVLKDRAIFATGVGERTLVFGPHKGASVTDSHLDTPVAVAPMTRRRP